MASEDTVDEVVSLRGTGNTPVARRSVSETVEADGQSPAVQQTRSGVEDEQIGEGGRRGRVLKESTQKLMEQFDKERQHRIRVQEGLDEETEDGETAQASTDPDDVGLVETETPAETAEAAATPPATPEPEVDNWRERMEAANRKLTEELDAERKRPRGNVSARLTALDEAEKAYVDEGPVAAFRRFLGVVLDAPHDSKEVDNELTGAYVDLTSKELNVPLEAAHQATRDAARTRLALARDRRERKAENDAKANAGDKDVDTRQAEAATAFIGSRLTQKRDGGKSFADEHPMLMALAEELEGEKPEALLWKTMQRETKIGNLNPAIGDEALISAAAKIIESKYKRLAEKLSKTQQTDTTSAEKPADANAASKDTRQNTGARTITNANASVAPATSPKAKTSKQPDEKPKFKNDKERREWLLNKHFPSGG